MGIEAGILMLVGTLLVIAASAVLAPKLRIAAPLILVLAGIGVSLVPFVPQIVVDPHVILLLLLPPLLYASAAAVPVMNFRRDFGAINGLSIVLVVLTALSLGLLFAWLLPDVGFAWGVALGAVLSPTDAVATTIIKARGVRGRVAVILDGEGLLNDASALVVLRTAIVAAVTGFSFWPAVGSFVFSVGIAVLVGIVVALLVLAMRCRVRDETVSTVLSFTTPFLAAVPVELLHGSGLVAAVVAGLVTSARGPHMLPPMHRISDGRNWATVEIVLEGLIFLTMGLQLASIVETLRVEPHGVARGLVIATLALAVALAVRAAYVAPLLWSLRRRAKRWQSLSAKVATMRKELEDGRSRHAEAIRDGQGWQFEGARMFRRLAVQLADIDYLSRHPLGAAESAIIIWAGMRGAITVAAVQLLPQSALHRPLLVFIAFAMAALSLLVQGGTVGFLASRLFPAEESPEVVEVRRAEEETIKNLLHHIDTSVARTDGQSAVERRRAVIRAQRGVLLDAGDHGVFEAETLNEALFNLDVDELLLDLRGEAAS